MVLLCGPNFKGYRIIEGGKQGCFWAAREKFYRLVYFHFPTTFLRGRWKKKDFTIFRHIFLVLNSSRNIFICFLSFLRCIFLGRFSGSDLVFCFFCQKLRTLNNRNLENHILDNYIITTLTHNFIRMFMCVSMCISLCIYIYVPFEDDAP